MMFIKTAKEFTDAFSMLLLVLTMNDNIISDVESTYISTRWRRNLLHLGWMTDQVAFDYTKSPS